MIEPELRIPLKSPPNFLESIRMYKVIVVDQRDHRPSSGADAVRSHGSPTLLSRDDPCSALFVDLASEVVVVEVRRHDKVERRADA